MRRLLCLLLILRISEVALAADSHRLFSYQNVETTPTPFREALNDLHGWYESGTPLPTDSWDQTPGSFDRYLLSTGTVDPKVRYEILLADLKRTKVEYEKQAALAKTHVDWMRRLHEELLDQDDLFGYLERQQQQQVDDWEKRDELLAGYAVVRLNGHQLSLSPTAFAVAVVVVVASTIFSFLLLVYVVVVLVGRLVFCLAKRVRCCCGRRSRHRKFVLPVISDEVGPNNKTAF